MKSLWNDDEAARFRGDLELRVYSSRLLGREPALVLHGGGNTSVKITERNLLGAEETLLYVKGSGWDLESIDVAGFAPVRLAHLVALSRLASLSDTEMVNELKTHMTRASAPTPSVEAILHAILPYRYVDHTHADAVVTITNTADGLERIREVYGDRVVVIPYVMPGFDLARLCAERFPAEAGPGTVGMVLMNHGIFSFGESARESYECMIDLVSQAEAYLQGRKAWVLPAPAQTEAGPVLVETIAALRHDLSAAAGAPMILSTVRDPRSMDFARRADLERISQQGPATPDHVIRTKRLPMLGRDVAAYARAYRAYFEAHAPRGGAKTMLDPAPRVVLDPELGLCVAGRTAKDAAIVRDLYRHTMEVILRASALGGYQALPAADIFDVEYWDLEQAKLRKGGTPPPFTGEVALVTGGASGIGSACVTALLERGAAVIALDLDARVTAMEARPGFRGIRCDVTDEAQVARALEEGVQAFGGLDMLILNAGVFPQSRSISELSQEEWRRIMAVNLDANLSVMRAAHPLLKQAPAQGRVVVIGSKNVPAPGPGAGAYSASKAALNQLARVAALEWGADGIRVNILHPNAVFDTGIWTREVLEARAARYGVSVEEYKARNVLRTEVTSRDVAELAAAMCGALFAKTTGAQVPVDGGNERVI
ncbi:MAG: short-chain dehydrogenase [Chromatiales bacterium 21-64-14]|nr:MAG: short-chain dehydrogenase [Chromatiales bacterium 21-64-14]HQU16476.1 bifunctional aldolase/short-chain dehydrogenase [Gammaproteobacteria bacterium]